VKRYQAAHGQDPLPALMAELMPMWGDADTAKKLQWPLFIRAGQA